MNKFKKMISTLLVSAMVLGSFAPAAFATEVTVDPAAETKAVTTEVKTEVVEEVASNIIDILTFNDFHGNVKESGKNIGMAKMVAVTNEKELANANTIVVSGGDNYQGSAMSNLTMGAPVNDMFKAMNVEVSAVGNHEFDWGISHMKEWQEKGDFNFLAANIIDTKTNKTVEWAKAYQIIEKNGKKIAFIGLSTTTTPTVTKSDNVAGLEFKNAAESAKEWVEFLKAGKAEEGTPDVILAITHVPSYQGSYGSDPTVEVTGDEMIELAKVEGLDGIISGHSHQTVAGFIEGTPVVQAYKYGRSMGKLAVEFNEDGSLKGITPTVEALYKRVGDIVADTDTVATYGKWNKELSPIMDEKIGVATETFTHNTQEDQTTPMGEFVCVLMADLAKVDIAIQNGGGLRRDMPKGDITMGLMYEIMPFDNTLYTIELTGADLIKNIDNGLNPEGSKAGSFSGLKVEYTLEKAAGERISKITLLDGTPIENDKMYKIVTNDFLAETKGADGYDFSTGTNGHNMMIPIRDAMVDYIKAAKTVTPGTNDYEVRMPEVVVPAVEVKEEVKAEVVVPAVEVKEEVKAEVVVPAVEVKEEVKAEVVVPAVEVKEEVKAEVIVPAVKVDAEYTVYTVKSGDMLWKIAEKFNTTYKMIGELNNLSDMNMINVGQVLKVPAK